MPRRAENETGIAELLVAGASTVGRILVYLAVALAIRRLLLFQIASGQALGFSRPSLNWTLLALALTAPLAILLHEGGHWVAGIATGQCFRRLVVGPVELARRAGRWRARLVPIRRAGLVDFVPATFAGFRISRAICVAGGPAASLLTGWAFLALSLRAGTSSLFWISSYCAQWSLIGLAGLLPLRRGPVRSDGYLLWQLARGGVEIDELQRNLLVASSYASPLRMREWPHDLMLRLDQVPSHGQVRAYNVYLAYLHFLDRGDCAEAGRRLVELMAEWSSADPPEYALEAAYFLALHGKQAEVARRWLALEDRDVEPWVHARAVAAVERASGGMVKARELVAEALARLQAAPWCGAYQYERDRLIEILKDAPQNK